MSIFLFTLGSLLSFFRGICFEACTDQVDLAPPLDGSDPLRRSFSKPSSRTYGHMVANCGGHLELTPVLQVLNTASHCWPKMCLPLH